MDDMINRQDAIEAVKQAIYNHDSAIMRITSLPSASVEVGEWIPCSERLPEPKGHETYLVTVAHYNPMFKGRMVTVTEYEARDDTPYWAGDYNRGDVRIVAWMPLPKPYEGSESDANALCEAVQRGW